MKKTIAQSMKDLLIQELENRKQENFRYSLRAFARTLKVNPSHLSKMMKGQISISEEKFDQFAKVLKVPARIAEQIKRRERMQKHVTEKDRWIQDVEKSMKFITLSLDQLKLMSDWYHYAILQLVSLRHFVADPKWIQQQLSITQAQAEEAVERLIRLKLIEVEKDGKWKVHAGHVTTYPQKHDALKNIQKQILNLAIEALDKHPPEDLHQAALTFSVSRKQVSKAKKELLVMQRAFATILEEDPAPKDHAYQLCISFFPLTSK